MKFNSFLLTVLTITTFSGCTQAVNYAFTSEQEQLLTEKYNQQYINQEFVKNDPEKITLINNYYDCKNGQKSAIEGCISHVSKSKYDIISINEYLTGLDKYISDAKKQ